LIQVRLSVSFAAISAQNNPPPSVISMASQHARQERYVTGQQPKATVDVTAERLGKPIG